MPRLAAVLEESVLYLISSALVALVLFGVAAAPPPWLPPQSLQSIRIAAAAAAWYCISISFSVFNKTFLSLWMGGWDYPIITTTIHMLLKVVISRIWMHCAYENAVVTPLGWKMYLWILTPIGVCTAADVMFSNLGIVYVPLSTYTAIKGSVAIFSYFAAIAMGLEEFSFPLLLSLAGIALGLATAVVSSTDATLAGILFCFAAAASGGLRWAVTQLLLQNHKECKDNFMLAIAMFSPMSFLSILPLCAIELDRFVEIEIRDNSWWILGEALVISICGGIIAFLLIAVEMHLLTLTSSINLGVLGQVKEMLQIILSIAIFHERLNRQSMVGMGIAIASGIAYRLLKSNPPEDEQVATVAIEAEVEEAEAAKPLIEMSVVQAEQRK